MADIIQFSKARKSAKDARKQRERAEKEATAASNRVRFGRTGAEKKQARLEQERQTRLHEGKRREPGDDADTDKSEPSDQK